MSGGTLPSLDGGWRAASGAFRSRAVEIVDDRHGFTWEFSSAPNGHLAEYDDEEVRLLVEAGMDEMDAWGAVRHGREPRS